MIAAWLLAGGLGSVVAAERPGLPASDPWTCPASHPIKGYASAEAGRRLYFVPGHRFYDEASPDRCYATEDEARRDGGRPAGVPVPPGTLTNLERRTWSWRM
jgi:hypothetical protein